MLIASSFQVSHNTLRTLQQEGIAISRLRRSKVLAMQSILFSSYLDCMCEADCHLAQADIREHVAQYIDDGQGIYRRKLKSRYAV